MHFAHHHPADHHPAPVPYITDADEHNFAERALAASEQRLVLVDFWAEWCPPCRALAPTLEAVARELEGRLLLVKVEVDDNMRLAGHYKLRGFPTVILFRHREQVARFAGNRPLHVVRDLVAEHLEEGSAHVRG